APKHAKGGPRTAKPDPRRRAPRNQGPQGQRGCLQGQNPWLPLSPPRPLPCPPRPAYPGTALITSSATSSPSSTIHRRLVPVASYPSHITISSPYSSPPHADPGGRPLPSSQTPQVRACRDALALLRYTSSLPFTAQHVPRCTGHEGRGAIYESQGKQSRSTLPPDKITPMRLPVRSPLRSSRAPMGTAADGSMTIFIRSQTWRIALMIAASLTVT